MFADKPAELITRDCRCEVPERVRTDGAVETSLDEAALRTALRSLADQDIKALAICFLYGFLNTAHEETAKRIAAAELPDVFVSASHDVAPEFREFERLSTTTGQRLSRTRDATLYPAAEGAADRQRSEGRAATHAVQWRRHWLRYGIQASGSHRAVGAVNRRRGGSGDRSDERAHQSHHVRCRRHVVRCGLASRRCLPTDQRGDRPWLSDQGADARHPHRRRRRRVDRFCR